MEDAFLIEDGKWWERYYLGVVLTDPPLVGRRRTLDTDDVSKVPTSVYLAVIKHRLHEINDDIRDYATLEIDVGGGVSVYQTLDCMAPCNDGTIWTQDNIWVDTKISRLNCIDSICNIRSEIIDPRDGRGKGKKI